MPVKYIFVTGGVVSGLGKGITAAALGRLLKQRGLRVRVQKLDPYLNVDPGTMSPYQHGEVFVTDDGAETDLDLGHYERFIDESLDVNSSVSAGRVYWEVLSRERRGDFLGGTVQIIPHITDEIKRRICQLDQPGVDVAIVEIGGTVGDIESQPFLEAIRQVAAERGRQNVMFLHVSLIVSIPGTGERKSKPTQHSAKELLGLGIQPDVMICRSDGPVPREVLEKISLFCGIPVENVIPNLTADLLYEVPLMLEQEGLAEAVVGRLGLDCHEPDLTEWTAMVQRARHLEGAVEIALVGKYVALHDAYLSVAEALTHAGIENGVKVSVRWVDSETVTDDNAAQVLAGCGGVLVPGGFGDRGVEGKISAIRYARENRVPFLGICLGMQMAVVELARHAAGLPCAHSAELDPQTREPVIALMPDQAGVTSKGGTMRLGSWPCVLTAGSRAAAAYGTEHIDERHRHRYEFNNDYRRHLEAAGLVLSGLSPDGRLVEAVELRDHPWFGHSEAVAAFAGTASDDHDFFAHKALSCLMKFVELLTSLLVCTIISMDKKKSKYAHESAVLTKRRVYRMTNQCIAGACLGSTGFSYTLSLINGKYKMNILYALMEFQVVRFNEMKKYIGTISYKTLSSSLKELESDGLVHREEYPQIPPKVEYSLTERGRSLIPILDAMCVWGEKNRQ